jgi:hypothetical protein
MWPSWWSIFPILIGFFVTWFALPSEARPDWLNDKLIDGAGGVAGWGIAFAAYAIVWAPRKQRDEARRALWLEIETVKTANVRLRCRHCLVVNPTRSSQDSGVYATYTPVVPSLEYSCKNKPAGIEFHLEYLVKGKPTPVAINQISLDQGKTWLDQWHLHLNPGEFGFVALRHDVVFPGEDWKFVEVATAKLLVRDRHNDVGPVELLLRPDEVVEL